MGVDYFGKVDWRRRPQFAFGKKHGLLKRLRFGPGR
jgi:hypothetical protein